MKASRLIAVIVAVTFLLNLNLPAYAAPGPEPAPGAPQAGTLSIWTNDSTAPVLEGLADDLWAGHQIVLTLEVHNSLRDDFVAAVAAGTAPDMIVLAHDQLGGLVSQGLMAPLTLNGQDAQFLPAAVEASTFNGQLYGVPWAVESLGFFYNTDLVPTPPTTWNEVRSMGEALMASGDVDYGLSVSGTTYDLYPLYTAFGGYIFGQDADGNWDPQDLGVDSPGMIAGLQWLVDRRVAGFISANTDWSNAHSLFETGKTPFIMAGPWSLDRIRSSGVPYAIADFPSQAQAGVPFMGAQVMAVNAASTNIANAETFLYQYFITEPTMTALAQATKRPPAYLPAIANITDPDMLAFAGIAGNASPMPAIPQMGTVWGNWNDAVLLALQGTVTAQQALMDAAARIRMLIRGDLTGMVNVPGSYQTQVGCAADWDPACLQTEMTKVDDTHWRSGPFSLNAGDYECKVALDGSWTLNYGVGGVQDGDNYQFTLPSAARVAFSYDGQTHVLTIEQLPPYRVALPFILRPANPPTWKPAVSPTITPINGLAMLDANNIWAVGANPMSGQPKNSVVLRWNGAAWQSFSSPTTTDILSDIDFLTPSDGWLVGTCRIWHWNGSNWQYYSSPSCNYIKSVEMVASNDVWALSFGSILHWNGSSWSTSYSLPNDPWLYDLDMVSASDGWFVSMSGNVYRWSGGAWNLFGNYGAALYAIDMVSATDGWIVGANGTILRWNGNTWAQVPSPISAYLADVSMASSNRGWIVGGTKLLMWDGASWVQQPQPSTSGLNTVQAVSETEAWAGGWDGVIIHYTNQP